ncbi:hypothetical protein [Caldinitratiruptor microaerophilus]|uniref:Uncharacterized protein n=1 Tax=Caldinitratiruptor microaerophilus TaxID=671077 RepID=A0AA35CMK3_9FIRM|nr:hypothetical protein [Caldinitratiruptor microaerophilus]BDG61897.1 hypothetical protein caldi_29870 [Caldinitratiruptor microaerophilus]
MADERYVTLNEERWDDLGKAIDAAFLLVMLKGKDVEVDAVSAEIRELLVKWAEQKKEQGQLVPPYLMMLALLMIIESLRLVVFKTVQVKKLDGGEVN